MNAELNDIAGPPCDGDVFGFSWPFANALKNEIIDKKFGNAFDFDLKVGVAVTVGVA